MPYTEAQKRATYRWRAKNLDKVNEARKVWNQNYYEKRGDFCKEKSNKYYYMKKEMNIFRNILLV